MNQSTVDAAEARLAAFLRAALQQRGDRRRRSPAASPSTVPTAAELFDAINADPAPVFEHIFTLEDPNSQLKLVQLMMAHGADVNKPDAQGRTPLIYAALQGYKSSVQAILKSDKIDLLARDANGQTAVMIATANDQVQIVRLMLDKAKSLGGTMLSDLLALENNAGETAFTIALKSGSTECADLISDFTVGNSRLSLEQAIERASSKFEVRPDDEFALNQLTDDATASSDSDSDYGPDKVNIKIDVKVTNIRQRLRRSKYKYAHELFQEKPVEVKSRKESKEKSAASHNKSSAPIFVPPSYTTIETPGARAVHTLSGRIRSLLHRPGSSGKNSYESKLPPAHAPIERAQSTAGLRSPGGGRRISQEILPFMSAERQVKLPPLNLNVRRRATSEQRKATITTLSVSFDDS